MIEAYTEVSLSPGMRQQIASLLNETFPDTFDGRTFFKQWPHKRLVFLKDSRVVGQLGLDFRVIRVADSIIGISGIIDLCVSQKHQGTGIGSALLQQAEIEARKSDLQFMVLMADKPDLYQRNGFSKVVPAFTKWLGIENLSSFALLERDLSDCFMAKTLTTNPWPPGPIDLLGYLF